MHFKNKIGEILTSGYWLIASLTGAFFCFFALNRGGVIVFIEAGFFFVLLNLITGQYKLKQIPSIYWITLAICLYLIIFGYLFASHEVKTKYVMYLIRMLFIAFTIHCLSLKKIDPRVYEFFPIVWCLSIGWQFVAVKFYNMPFGTYGNPHYLSNFVISILPLIIFSFWTADGWYKWLYILFALLAVDMLLRTGSRTAFLGISVSVVFTLIFLTKSHAKWIGILLLSIFIAAIYYSNYGGVVDRVKELLVNLADEERVFFWKSAAQMLQKNSLIDWIFGNGLGSYRAVYPEYAMPQFRQFWFAHLHPIEILYENGFTGVLLVFGGLAVVFVWTIKASKNSPGNSISILLKCMLVIFMCWMIHSSLTFPFYSKYAQYPLGFILGTMLALLDQSRFTKQEQPILGMD